MKLKKLFNLKKQNRREPRANEFALESLEPRLLLSATPMTAPVVTTDHLDYAPGETAVITASSQAGELVGFQVSRTDGMADAASTTADVGPAGNEAWYVIDGVSGFTAHLGADVSGDGVADWIAPDNDQMVNGSISTTWYVEEQYRHSSLLVTATGQESGSVATQAFTDANLNTTTVVTSSGASTYGDFVTLTATVTPAVGGTTRPVGSVEFFDNGVSIGVTSSAGLGAGSSSTFAITLSNLTAGSHAITAQFTGGANASDSFNDSTSGTLTQTVSKKALVGNFTADFKTYDGTNAATVLFTDVTGTVGSDFVTLDGGIATFANANAGVNKIVTLTGATLGGPDAANYTLTSVATTTSDIDQAIATITVNGFTGVVDGNPHGATGTAIGVLGENLNGLLTLGATFTNAPGGVANWTFNGGTNYASDGGSVNIVLSVASVNTTTTISSDIAASTYGQAVTFTATVTAASGTLDPAGTVQFFDGATLIGSSSTASDGGVGISTFSVSVATLNVAGPHSIQARYLSNGTFFNSNSGSIAQTVSKADATFGYSGTYDGTAHGARAIGVFGEILAGMNAPTTRTNAGSQNVSFNFTDVSGNYNDVAGGTATISIAQASATVSDYFGTYDGAAHGAIATGVLGESLSGLVSGTRTNAGLSTVSWTFTDVTGNYNDNTGTNNVEIAAKEITGNVTVANKTYDGTTTATGVNRTLTGVVAGDIVNLTGGSATFDTKDVGIGKVVTLAGVLTLTGADAANYTLSPSLITTSASITAKSVTGSFTAVGKVYDATTAGNAVNRTLAGVIAADLGNVILSGGTATFANANVGANKVVTLASATLTGGAAGNYTLTSVATATADITVRGITGSFTAANKTYDGNAVAGVVTRTLTGVIAGDAVSLTGGTASFADKNVGIAKTVTLTGATLSGAAAGNYSLQSVATTTANITALGLTGNFTVTATKVYDGNASANVLTRTLTGVIAGDVVTLTGGTAAYNNANVGNNKTVTLTGATLTGAGAGNYTLTSVNTTTASITAKSLTGSFTAGNKVYDTTTAATVLTQTLTGVLAGDVVNLTGGIATFADANAGTGKTVTLVGATLTGAAAGNYSLASVGTTTANITRLGITGGFAADNKVYDGTANAVVLFTDLTGFFVGDDVFLDDLTGTASFNNANAGLNKTVTLVGATLGGVDAGNYNLLSVATTTADIDKAVATISVTGYSGTYDAAAHGATGSATGVIGENLSASLNLGANFTNAPGGTANWTFTGGINYTNQSGNVAILISKANVTFTVTGYAVTYDGNAHTATATATGVLGESLSGVDVSGTTHTNVGTGVYHDTVTFTDTTGNYLNASKLVNNFIGKANIVFTVAGYAVRFDGVAHTATATATGVSGEDLSAGVNLGGTTHTNVGTGVYHDTVTFTDTTGNYRNATKLVNNYISKANIVFTVTGYAVTYDGTAHTATATATGVVGEDLSAGVNLSGTTHTNVGTGVYTDTVTYTDQTGNYFNATKLVKNYMSKAAATLTVTGYNVVYDGAAHTATATATGALGESLSGVDVSGTTHTNVGTGVYTDTVTFTDTTGNYKNATKFVKDYISKATVTLTVTGYNVVYNGAAHTATATATGVLGESLSGVDVSGTTHTNVGTGVYTDTVTYTDATGNYKNATKFVKDYISKATVTLSVTGYAVHFDGAAHTATGTATGVLGESLSGVDVSGTTHTAAGTYTDTVTFTDVTGNYKSASKLVKNFIV
jgi:hypothetical protein